MVMFTCNRCSAALKKSQVETHAFGCGGPSKINLTCHDCLKDFRGKEYESHTSCISEEARYGGKGIVVKEAGKKQNQWCEVVRNVLANNKTLEPSVVRFLKSAERLPNIPRKKPQFKNWANNVKISSDNNLIDEVFNLLKAEFSRTNSTEQPKGQISSTDKDQSDSHRQNGIANKGCASDKDDSNCNENGVDGKSTKKKKKNKKLSSTKTTEDIYEDKGGNSKPTNDSSLNGVDGINENGDVPKKKKNNNKNKKSKDVTMETSQGVVDESIADDIAEEPMELEGSPVVTKGKPAQAEIAAETADPAKTQKLSKKERRLLKKKEKFEAEVAEIESFKKEEEGEELVEEEKPKKSKKRKNEVVEKTEGQKDDKPKKRKMEGGELVTEVPPEEEKSPQKVKFNWHETILAILRKSKNDEMPVKKVTKRVIDEYMSQFGDKGIHEKLYAKMNKKLQTCPGTRVLKEKVKLVNSDR